MQIKIKDSDRIEIFFDSILTDTAEVAENCLKRSAQVVKKKSIDNLNKLRTQRNDPGYKHMADDVQVSVTKDRWGDKIARIRGGKKTGRKWHLVNDGTYKSGPTHFMDVSLTQSEPEIEQIFEDEMKKGGF